MPTKALEPNWDSLGDKELAAIIRSRTGEDVNPGRMAHANLVAKAQAAFRHGADAPLETTAMVTGARPAIPATPAAPSVAADTAPKSGRHDPAELAESSSGNPLNEMQPERRAFGDPEPKMPLKVPPQTASTATHKPKPK